LICISLPHISLPYISLPYISLAVCHRCKIAIFNYWLVFLYPRQENQHVSKIQ
jgi:hypothetical protein